MNPSGEESTAGPIVAHIALGSNLGDRAAVIFAALGDLDAVPGISVVRVSQLIETQPEGPPGQGPYLNGAAELRTVLPARALLERLLEIERRHGRERLETLRNGPRTLDLDLLLYGDAVLDEPGLVVPHPRMHLRRFVLQPLAEIAGPTIHPRLAASVQSLLDSLARTPLPGG